MKKFLLLAVLFSLALSASSQTLVTGKWRYQYVLFDSTARLPLDTLASSPVGSLSQKNNVVYNKRSDGFWYAVGAATVVDANEGTSVDAGNVQLGQARTAVGDPAAINDDRVIPILNGSYIWLKDQVLNAHTLFDASFIRINDSAQANYATYGSSNIAINTLTTSSYLSYTGGVLDIIDSNSLPVVQVSKHHLTDPTTFAQLNPGVIYLGGDEATGTYPFINLSDQSDFNTIFQFNRRSATLAKSEILYGNQGTKVNTIDLNDSGKVRFRGITSNTNEITIDGDSAKLDLIANWAAGFGQLPTITLHETSLDRKSVISETGGDLSFFRTGEGGMVFSADGTALNPAIRFFHNAPVTDDRTLMLFEDSWNTSDDATIVDIHADRTAAGAGAKILKVRNENGDAFAVMGTGQTVVTNDLNVGTRLRLTTTLTSSAGTLDLTTNIYSVYVFSGTTATWTLPEIAQDGFQGSVIYIKNKGSGNITLDTFAAGNDIYTTSAVSTLAILPGEGIMLLDDGTHWSVMKF
jgi:hypothetical protein